MNDIEELYNRLVNLWSTQTKGRGSINFGAKVNPFPVVLGVLYKIYEKSPNIKVLIVTKNNEERNKLINYLTHTDVPSNNEQFSSLIKNRDIRILSIDIVKTWNLNIKFELSICIGLNYYDNTFYDIWFYSKFKLMCLTANTETTGKIYQSCPEVISDAVSKIENLISTPPVEETQIGIAIDSQEDIDLLKKYDTYINESIIIFGDFNNISMAIHGEPRLNISAISYCTDIARRNGWNENLDMSIEHNRRVDDNFNPSNLCERARNTYDIRAKRSKLLSDNNSKLKKILEICLDNVGKKILIINKTSDFAKTVTDYLNAHLEHYSNGKRFYDACYNYHEDVDAVYALDGNGERIKVKSGVAKGTYKLLKGKAQKSAAVDYFNNGLTFILSANNAPDRALSCDIDLLILTSSLCETIDTYIDRLSNVNFTNGNVKAIKLYCVGTMEERYLTKEKPSSTHTIINNCEKDIIVDNLSGNILVI